MTGTTTTTRPHPTTRTYWLVALFLGVVTALEVGIVYVPALDVVRGILLVALGAAKFFTVVAVFMHLRYDLSVYRFYFLIGLAGATVVFAVTLAAFRAL